MTAITINVRDEREIDRLRTKWLREHFGSPDAGDVRGGPYPDGTVFRILETAFVKGPLTASGIDFKQA